MNPSVKEYELTFEPRPNYLIATVKAKEIDRVSALDYLKKVAAKCAELQVRSLIIVRDIPTMLPDADLFTTTIEYLEMIRGIKTAFVNPYPSIQGSMDFALMIGTNRGARYKLFEDLQTAEKWLLGPTD